MKDLYSDYIDKLQITKLFTKKYGFSTEKIEDDEKEIKNFKITVPFIGGFSTGKSTLINALIEKELFSTEITPETAIPTELSFGKNNITYYTKEGEFNGTINEVNTKNLQIHHINLISVTMENQFLKYISNIKIVDMPGFDSGYEIHNRAIDEYLPNSLAYIITVSVDEGTIRESILNFLHELKINEMPVYVVITKTDKSMPEELDEMVKHVKEVLEYRLKLFDVKIALTSSELGKVEDLKNILIELQNRSDELFKNKFSKKLCIYLNNLQKYLVQQINLKDNNLEELQIEKELLEEKISNFENSMKEEKNLLIEQAKRCQKNIQNKIEMDLRNSSMILENILINGGNIQEKVNYIIRNAITLEIRNQLETKIKKYLKDISDLIQTIEMPTNIRTPLLQQDIIADNEKMRSSLQEIVVPISTIISGVITGTIGSTIAGTLGIATSVLGPLGAAVGIIVGTLLGNEINKRIREKEAEQQREAAAQQVYRMIQEITISVIPQIEASICEIINKVIQKTDSVAEEKIALQRKGLVDLEKKMLCTKQQHKKMEQEMIIDLKQVQLMLKEEGIHCDV